MSTVSYTHLDVYKRQGLDLVALQLQVADGRPLEVEPRGRGHAVEARVYAEAPERGFLPSTGTVLLFEAPDGVRVDAAVETGSVVTGYYDPMIAKVIAHGCLLYTSRCV